MNSASNPNSVRIRQSGRSGNGELQYMLAELDDSGREQAIYYLSKRMLEYETRYIMIERFCLALV